jgi:purine-binding chemotaxis protein CheW
MTESTLSQVLTQRREISNEIVNVDEPSVKLVIVSISGEWFAFHGSSIREILAQAKVFFIPGCPDSMEGVINLRGNIESVIRLQNMLQLPPPQHTDNSHILIGQTNSMSSGIRVDKVIDMIDVVESELQSPPSTLPSHLSSIVSSIIQFQKRPIAVLDLERIFDDYHRGLG